MLVAKDEARQIVQQREVTAHGRGPAAALSFTLEFLEVLLKIIKPNIFVYSSIMQWVKE